MDFEAMTPAAAPDAIAPDGSEVRILCGLAGGGMALFSLASGAVARAVAHRSVEEIWYILCGQGRIWRRQGGHEEITALARGLSLSLPAGTQFQFRCDGGGPLTIVAVTMPPWPGPDEAYAVAGLWEPTV